MADQRTEEWFAERLGHASASRFKDILAKTKSGPSASRKNYATQLVCEILTGKREETYVNAAMQRGTDIEPMARMAYESRTGEIVQEAGFLKHALLRAGASPDGLIGEDGGMEIKCPNTATHIETLLDGMPAEHKAQIQGAMWITGRAFWDFVSYDDRLPEEMRLYVERVFRDDVYIAALAREVETFIGEVDSTVSKLKEKFHG